MPVKRLMKEGMRAKNLRNADLVCGSFRIVKKAAAPLCRKRISCRCGRKPSSVVGRSSILAACCHTVVAISLEARRAAVLPLFGSCIRWGLQRASVARARVSSYLAFPSLLHACAWGGFFLLHFPWSCLHRPLTGTLPCDARTFLTVSRAIAWPPDSMDSVSLSDNGVKR